MIGNLNESAHDVENKKSFQDTHLKIQNFVKLCLKKKISGFTE